ncbi:MAG: hypothetical protein ABIG90_03055 [bacterium]
MPQELQISKLKKDYFKYVLTWADRKKLLKSRTKFSVKWDADGDRVFFKDEKNQKVPSYFIGALLAKIIQKKYPKAKILHDARLFWAIQETAKNTHACKAGWSNFLNYMRKNKIFFGVEASGHYYFNREFVINDSLIPILLIVEQNKSLSELVKSYRQKYFISGEINFKKKINLKELEKKYQDAKISHLDGLSIEYKNWRFNIRQSQTENLWRLNIEARSKNILKQKQKELEKIIKTPFK